MTNAFGDVDEGYECICASGYEFQSGVCVDVDECDLNSNICGDEETCENIEGGYICHCAPGLIEIDEDHCIDINECATGLMCDDIEICVNTRGSYTCLCVDGYERDRVTDEDGVDVDGDCVDIDECADNSFDCKETENCFNTEAGFQIIDGSFIGFIRKIICDPLENYL